MAAKQGDSGESNDSSPVEGRFEQTERAADIGASRKSAHSAQRLPLPALLALCMIPVLAAMVLFLYSLLNEQTAKHSASGKKSQSAAARSAVQWQSASSDSAAVLIDKAKQAIAAKRYAKAAVLSQSAIEMGTSDGSAYITHGTALALLEKNPEEALRNFEEGIKLNPDLADQYFYDNRADCYIELCQFEDALRELDKSLSLKKNSWRMKKKGEILVQLHREHEAVDAFAEAANLDPHNKWIWFERGQTDMSLKEWRQALADFSNVIKIDPGDSRAYLARAKVYAELGDKERARQDEERANQLIGKE